MLPTTHDFRVTVMSSLLKLVPVTHSIKQSYAEPIPNQAIRCTRVQLSEQRSRNYSVVTIRRVICSYMRRLTPTARMMRKTRAGPKPVAVRKLCGPSHSPPLQSVRVPANCWPRFRCQAAYAVSSRNPECIASPQAVTQLYLHP
jgi:hypothetical protein